jgi:hypothetical protein
MDEFFVAAAFARIVCVSSAGLASPAWETTDRFRFTLQMYRFLSFGSV